MNQLSKVNIVERSELPVCCLSTPHNVFTSQLSLARMAVRRDSQRGLTLLICRIDLCTSVQQLVDSLELARCSWFRGQQKRISLFDTKELPSVKAVLEYDSKVHGFNLDAVCKSLCESLHHVFHERVKDELNYGTGTALDFYGRIRLVNYIRKEVIR